LRFNCPGDRSRPAAGFTLVEVLVSLIILSIGVLGVAKLTLTATRANDSAYIRTQATEFAYQILDQMRANRATALIVQGPYVVPFGPVTAQPQSCSATACTGAELAALDIYNWKQVLATQLQADGSITTAQNGTEVTATIVVEWNDQVASSTFKQSAANATAYTTVTLETVL
jgi:type IV pilus assembly protein PilV